jgi:BCD family chlorophyll transporter-like MFS transporter
VQATSAGVAIALGGLLRDVLGGLAMEGHFGAGMAQPSTGYSIVYHLEILLLFLTLVAIGPLVRHARDRGDAKTRRFGLADLPT